MSVSSSKTCPKCGGRATATVGESLPGFGHIAHSGAHVVRHPSLLGAVLTGGGALLKKVLPKGFKCDRCGHRFGN